MYFKKLEIFGFKSFADKTELNFEPGITAVVGPNGCGKSNVFDAIRWVLGEQSMKQLRGSSRADVIFNGTNKKSSLGFAEVSVTFGDTADTLSVEGNEVTVTRKLFRSGESQYMINRASVRLKDVQELLMGTGIGAEAYSLVQQGKVEMVVSAKPEDRRMILDEASGITKYKAKKKEAMSKLKSTENNLLRVNDITTEVKRQIGSIERQANKARKYQGEFEKLKALEVRMAEHQMSTFTDEKEEIENKVKKFNEKDTKLNQELEELSGTLTNEVNYLDEIEQKINEANAQEIKLEGQIDLNNRQIGFNQERIGNLEENKKRFIEQKEQLIERCRVQQTKIDEMKLELEAIENNIQENQKQLSEKREELLMIEKQIKDSKDQIRENEEKILSLTSSQVNVRNTLTDNMKEMQGALARKRRLELENEKVLDEKKQVDDKLQNVEYQIHALEGSLAEYNNQREAKQSEVNSVKNRLDQVNGDIDELEKKRLFFKSQKEFIEKLHAQYDDIPDPVVEGKFITEIPPEDHHTGIIGKVKEVKRKDKAPFRPSFFRRPSEEDSKQLYEVLCETKFIELDVQQMTAKIEEITQKIDGLLIKKEELSKEFDMKNDELLAIESEIQEKEKSVSILKAQRNDINEEVNKLNNELELVEADLIEVKDTLVDLKKREDELNYKLDTVNQDIDYCTNDIKEKQNTIALKAQNKESLTIAVTQLETENASEMDKLKSQQENHRTFSESLDSWLEEIKKFDDELSQQEVKREQYEKEIETLIKKIEEIKVEKESLREVINEQEVQKNDLAQRINSTRAQMTAYEEDIIKIKQELHETEMIQQKLGFREQNIKDRLLQTYKIDFDEVKRQEQEAQAQPQVVAEGEEGQTQEAPAQEEGPFDPEQAAIDLEKLRKRCESYGAVNLVAIEEFEELKQRFEFLTKQQSDLLEAKSQLMSTINKINRSTRQMFMDTFTKVSEEFRIYYRMLFGGGEANLVLLDPDNVLESGIDIVARPPGKKLQNISLLSGGEKTLTAIALIFGVFKVNPSPFCVLDEIDAALDESNVGRFSYLLQDFAKIAQFIVITHNKKTMSSADVMYGITMPETGCSRVVSVKFSEDEKKKAEEVAVG